MMSKFKVGDKVRYVKKDECDYGFFNIGDVLTVTEVLKKHNWSFPYSCEYDGASEYLSEDSLELVVDDILYQDEFEILDDLDEEPIITGQEVVPNLESRYTTGSGKQLYDIMEDDLLEPDEARGFYKGNIYKYVKRYPKKNGIEDLEKAKDYINQLIELEKKLGEVD